MGNIEVLEFKVPYIELGDFMSNNKDLLVSQAIDVAEYMLSNSEEKATICILEIEKTGGNSFLRCNLFLEDFIKDLDILLEWTVEEELYELSHRLQVVKEKIENDSRGEIETANEESSAARPFCNP